MTSNAAIPLPPDEEDRLAALAATNILDSAPEEEFERIVDMAISVFDVPIAAISMIDRDRQWFKAARGLALQETPREVAFCSYTIMKEGVYLVPDAGADPRFRANPLVTHSPAIRFYAGAPVHSEDGYRIGTLCLIDSSARGDFDTDKQSQLLAMAAIVDNAFKLRERSLVRDAAEPARARTGEEQSIEMHSHRDAAVLEVHRPPQGPVEGAVTPTVSQTSSLAVSERPMRILLADDNETNQAVAMAILDRAGHEVRVVGNGGEAVSEVATGTYDLVLMDMMMPETDGLAATRAIRKLSGPEAAVYIIAVTANASAEDRAKCFAAGMNDHIAKPITIRSLMGALERYLSRLSPPPPVTEP